jgi:putative ABC transport system permease protein
MTVGLIVRRSLRQHALTTVVTAASIAMGAGLLMAVWMVKEQAQRTFSGVNTGFDAVLGARGSKLQLVLNAVFHLESSPGNLRWEEYETIRAHPSVALAVPLAMGDNFRGWRIVGTLPDFFERTELDATGRRFRLAQGRWFDPTLREAVVGSFAARRLGLKVGEEFEPYHGLEFDEHSQHEETYVVVGILESSNTPADRVIWIPLEGVQWMGGHDPKAVTDISAVLLRLKGGGIAGFQLDQLYNKQGDRLTFAWPIGAVVADLFGKLAWFDRVLAVVAWLVVLVATASIMAGIYNSMNERRRELAILRALGARRLTLSAAVVLEAASIAALGVAAGCVVCIAILTGVASLVRSQTGVVLEVIAWDPVWVLAPLAIMALGALAGLIPALKAYRTDVAENLTPHS